MIEKSKGLSIVINPYIGSLIIFLLDAGINVEALLNQLLITFNAQARSFLKIILQTALALQRL